jgi:hypothetical protein
MPPSTRRLERMEHSNPKCDPVISTTLTKPFPFLELPDTVRQRFYELQLEAPRGFVRLFSKSGPLRVDSKVTPANIKVNIMFTCRQIYQEAIPVLYRVNNFCIAPLPLRPNHSSDDRDMLQSERLIHNMPVRGRNLINKLELWLPIPPPVRSWDTVCTHWQPMRDLFPGLKTLTFFFDLNHQLDRSWWAIPEPDDCETYYKRFRDSMPQARQTFIDPRMLKPSLVEWQPLIDTIYKMWDVSTGESVYITQDIHHANKHSEQKKVVDKALADEFGSRASMHQGLSYWRIRQNQAANQNESLTDDDTDDEVECYHKFDAEMIVGRLRKKIESLSQGSFDFEEEEGSWW